MKNPLSRLRLKDLELLREIAAQRSLTAVADAHGYTQPALSRSLREIETALGTRVFTRDRTVGLVPTPLGRLILARVDLLLAEAEGLQEQVLAFEEGRGAHLRLGIIPFVSNRLMLAIVRGLAAEPHAMSISTYEESTDQLLAALRRQELDAVLGRISVEAADDELHQERLFTQSASVVVHADGPFGHGEPLNLRTLHQYEWVLPPRNSPTRLAFTEAFVARNAKPPAARIESTSARLVHTAISAGVATLGLLPMDLSMELESWGGGIKTRNLPVPFRMPPVGLITLQKRRDLPATRLLRSVVHDALARSIVYS